MYNDETEQRAMDLISELDELIRQLHDANANDTTITTLEAALAACESIANS